MNISINKNNHIYITKKKELFDLLYKLFEVQQQSNEKIQYEIQVIVDLYNQNDQDILLHLDDMYHIDVYHHKHPREKE